MTRFDGVLLSVLWNRLIAITDEASTALLRTAFSPIVRDSGDYTCLIVDDRGKSLAQSTKGIAALATAVSVTTRYVLDRFPKESWRPGDVAMTNNPWYAAGHAGDVATVSPIFFEGRLVAFATVAAHVPDIGGMLAPADAREVYEEGILFPPIKLMREGRMDEDIEALIRMNVRMPDLVMGDLHAQVAAEEICARGMDHLMKEYRLQDLSDLATDILDRSEGAMRQAVSVVPEGRFTYDLETDEADAAVTIRLAVHREAGDLVFDYTGSSPQVARGVNCVLNYTRAYTLYTAKCILDPEGPNNEGSMRPLRVIAPQGSILNAVYPAPVYARSQTGHYLGSVVMGALAKAVPEKVLAESGSPSNRTVFSGLHRDGRPFNYLLFTSGGMGAAASADGLSCAPFPSNTGSGSIERAEQVAPLVFWAKAFRPDSGGPGEHRGGLGQHLEIEIDSETPVAISTRMDRIQTPPKGLFGGLPGACAAIRLESGKPVAAKGRGLLDPGERLIIETPGGGGYGPPEQREAKKRAEDLRQGYVTADRRQEVRR